MADRQSSGLRPPKPYRKGKDPEARPARPGRGGAASDPKKIRAVRRSQAARAKSQSAVPDLLSRAEIERLVHDLQVHQIELEMQNHELRAAQASVEESRQKYSDLYDFAPVGYVTLTAKGVVREINLTAATQLGIERVLLFRKPFSRFIHSQDRQIFHEHRNAVFKSQSRQSCEIRIKKREQNGDKFFHAQMESILVQDEKGRPRCRTAISDVSARREAEEKLWETNETLRALITASPLAIYSINPGGLVQIWNPAAERIFGWKEKEMVGRPLPSIPEDKREEFALLQGRILAGETVTGLETVRQRKDGARMDVSISTALLHKPNGSIGGIMAIVEEITERKKSESAIRKMNQALREKNLEIERASQARKEFFSYISHELKTPLNSILGFTQLLRNGNYGALAREQGRAMGVIHKNAGELLRLINNILELAKIESGKMSLQLMETNLPEMVERVAVVFEPFIQERGLRFDKKFDPMFPILWKSDPIKMRSILTNLISNAVKFTEKGLVLIELEFDAKRREICVAVSDTGAGISRENIEKIFRPYEQSTGPRGGMQEYTGTGLGLTIVKKMVSALGGRIEVDSAPGKGTTFTLHFPEVSPP